MRNGQVALEKYIITKTLTKPPEAYPDAKNQPHVQVISIASSWSCMLYSFILCDLTYYLCIPFHWYCLNWFLGGSEIEAKWLFYWLLSWWYNSIHNLLWTGIFITELFFYKITSELWAQDTFTLWCYIHLNLSFVFSIFFCHFWDRGLVWVIRQGLLIVPGILMSW